MPRAGAGQRQRRGDECQASLAVPQPGHHGQRGTAAGKNSPPYLELPDLKGNQLLQQPGPQPGVSPWGGSADTGMAKGTGERWEHGSDFNGTAQVGMLSLAPTQW